MDAFEQVVSEMLWMDGFWVQTSVKVNLTPKEKKSVGKPTMPRPELDIVGYGGLDNSLYVVERKSFINSRGVTFAGLSGADAVTAGGTSSFPTPMPNCEKLSSID